VAIVADRDLDARLLELRIYFSTWPLTGGHAIRPPLLQPDPEVHEADVVGEYQRALAAGTQTPRWRASSRMATFANPPVASTSIAAMTSCACCTSCSSPTVAASPGALHLNQ
jgi:hypothetical protein